MSEVPQAPSESAGEGVAQLASGDRAVGSDTHPSTPDAGESAQSRTHRRRTETNRLRHTPIDAGRERVGSGTRTHVAAAPSPADSLGACGTSLIPRALCAPDGRTPERATAGTTRRCLSTSLAAVVSFLNVPVEEP